MGDTRSLRAPRTTDSVHREFVSPLSRSTAETVT